jgi:hypothetical protein
LFLHNNNIILVGVKNNCELFFNDSVASFSDY